MIKSFEGVRGLAAIFVVVYHLGIGRYHIPLFTFGYLFVDLFFILSGYLIGLVYSDKLGNLYDLLPFMVRRFGRLFPLLMFSTLLYIASMNFAVVAVYASHTMAGHVDPQGISSLVFYIPQLSELLATIFMVHSLGLFDHAVLNYSSWSISTEFYTYLAFAMVCVVFKKTTKNVLLLCCVTVFAIAVYATIVVNDCIDVKKCYDLTYDFGIARCISGFFLGALIARWHSHSLGSSSMVQVLAIVLLLVFFAAVAAYPAAAIFSPVVFSALLLSIKTDVGVVAKIFSTRPMQILGQRSYSVYMLHIPMLVPLRPLIFRLDSVLEQIIFLGVFLGILIYLAGWTYKFIEDPLRIRFNRYASGLEVARATRTQPG